MTTSIHDSPERTARTSGSARRREREEALRGVRAMLPWLLGVAPFGMVVGITARTSDLPAGLGLFTGATIYSGSAQLTALELLDGGAGIGVVVVSVLIINARLILYSGSIAPSWRGTGLGFRAAAAALLVDPSYAVGMHRYERETECETDSDTDRETERKTDRETGRLGHIHYLAAGITLFVVWHVAMVSGALIGAGVPAWLGLEHTIPLFLLAEVLQAVRSTPAAVAALVGAIVTTGGTGLPLHSGLLAGVAVGVTAAVLTERWTA